MSKQRGGAYFGQGFSCGDFQVVIAIAARVAVILVLVTTTNRLPFLWAISVAARNGSVDGFCVESGCTPPRVGVCRQ